ncbi:MAG: hypothetical protein OXH22_07155 [Chloroflexi bacterium]|nr:hypothetical protein [Chloroflexota bacterium]
MRAQIVAIILGVVTLVVGMLVAGILDHQATHSGDSAARCKLKVAAAPYAKDATVTLKSQTADCDDAISAVTAAGVIAPLRNPTPVSTAQAVAFATAVAGADESRPGIASFSGAKPLNDLVPTLVRVVLVMVGVGMIGIGGMGFMRRGPLANA